MPLGWPCHKPYGFPGFVCHRRIVPSSGETGGEEETRQGAKGVAEFQINKLTTSARVHLAVRAVHHAVHGAVVALVELALFAVLEAVDAHPRVAHGARDEAIALRRVKRGGGGRVGQGERVRGRGVGYDGVEGDVVGVREHERPRRRGELERGDGHVEGEAVDWAVGAHIPPSGESASVRIWNLEFGIVLGTGDTTRHDLLDQTILAATHDAVPVGEPDDALDRLVVRAVLSKGRKKPGVGVGTVEIEDADLLLLIAGDNVGSGGGDVDGANDVVVWKGMEGFARVRVPDFAAQEGLVCEYPCCRMTKGN
jgi:hypothetical protein